MQFGEYEVDADARELRRSGVRVRLQEQPFQILAMLLERPGAVVTRDDFRARLWPEGTFVDFEHSLNAAIKRLRLALGDTADRPRFIETQPRRGYRFIGILQTAPQSDVPPAPRRSGRPRLMVLPFTNLSDVEQDYFTDGLTEEMIAQLGRRCASRIGVLARYTSVSCGEVAAPAPTAIHVDYLVQGSVRREGSRVRITARLVETGGGTQLWAESYDRQLEDCLSVQAEVVAQIAQALTLELLPASSPARSTTSNTGAYQAFLRGRYYWNKNGDDGLDEAVRYYDRAIELDRDFGMAYAARARAGVARCEYYLAEPTAVLDGIRQDALRALDLDPGDSEALVALGEFHRISWQWADADACYRAALEANPNSESTHRYYALFLAARGYQDAVRIVDRGWDLDPLCLVNNTAAASVRYFTGDYEAAIARCRQTLDIDPTFGPARRRLASALAEIGQVAEALDEYALVSPHRLDPVSRAWMGHALAVAGNRTAARAVAASLESRADGQAVPPYHLAILYAGLADADRAFDALHQACEAHDPWLSTVHVEPRFRGLRGDSRYARLADRLRLTAGVAAV